MLLLLLLLLLLMKLSLLIDFLQISLLVLCLHCFLLLSLWIFLNKFKDIIRSLYSRLRFDVLDLMFWHLLMFRSFWILWLFVQPSQVQPVKAMF